MKIVNLIFSFVASIVLACAAGTCIQAQQSHTVTVTGSATVKAKPDRVAVSLKTSNTETGIIEVRDASDNVAKAILEQVKKHGVTEKDFDVSDLSISIGYSSELERNIYTVTRQITVELGEIKKLNPLLAGLLKTKSTEVQSINFKTNNQKDNEFEARKLAMVSAREKASQLAELADQKLGRAISIQVKREINNPFVTSVEPSIGKNEGLFFKKYSASDRKLVKRKSGQNGIRSVASDSPDPSTILVSTQFSGVRIQDPANQAFGLGEIDVSVTLDVVFEMNAK